MTVAELQSRILARVGEDPAAATGNQYYTAAEALAALNMAQRLFVFLTLCLETTSTITLSPGVAFYNLLPLFSDWLLPLRIRGTGKLRPVRLSDLAALDSGWFFSAGTPSKYAMLGFDLLAVYQQPATSAVLTITYARCPLTLYGPSESPEIPPEYHHCLIEAAIPFIRAKEGAQEWQKVVPLFDRFMEGAAKLGEYVRARNKEQGYDYLPFELAKFDRSRLVQISGNS